MSRRERRRRSTDAERPTPRGASGRLRPLAVAPSLGRRFQLDNLAHTRHILRSRAPEPPCPDRDSAMRTSAGRRAQPARRRAAADGSLAGLQADLTHQLALAGHADGAYVYDLTAKQALFSERASTLRPPASVEKLYTATTALERMGASAHLSTTVYGTGRLAPGGVWEGNIYLRGGGDPTFGSSAFIRSHYDGIGASVSSLVAQLVRTDGIRRITGSVLWRRVLVRLAARRALQRLRARSVPGRHALGARLQPRRIRLRERPARAGRLRRPRAAGGAEGRWRGHRRAQRRRHHAGRGDSAGAGRTRPR